MLLKLFFSDMPGKYIHMLFFYIYKYKSHYAIQQIGLKKKEN